MLGLGNSLVSPSYVGGFENKYSLSFDSTDDFLEAGTLNTHLKNVQKFTISMWVYQEDLSTSGQNGLFGKHDSDHHRTYAKIGQDGKMDFGVENGSGSDEGGRLRLTNADLSSADTWYHIVCVFDGTQTDSTVSVQNKLRAKIYIDGVNKSVTDSDEFPTHTSNSTNYGNFELRIGNFQNGTGDCFHGEIDEVGIWNEALDADAVSALYNSGVPFDISQNLGNYDNAANLQAWYRMGDGTEAASGTTIYDMSGNSNDATMTNMDAATDYSTNVPS
tara:strand:+ start:3070 stop:3894 length:825 start_codon:yes stop_codon:yes gene_type:complete